MEGPGGGAGGHHQQGPPEASSGQRAPEAAVPSRHGRLRASSVASASVAAKPEGPV